MLPQSYTKASGSRLLTTLPLRRLPTVSVCRLSAKVALTFWLSPTGTKEHMVVLDTQLPPNATKREPTPGAALRITVLPSNIGSEQSGPQLMPVEVTVPLPA